MVFGRFSRAVLGFWVAPGEFAMSPHGTGAVLRALAPRSLLLTRLLTGGSEASSSALEQCRDRGVECLHLLGTENLLARVCDPVFIGFCRHLDVDCAAKVSERSDIAEEPGLVHLLGIWCVSSKCLAIFIASASKP